MAKLVLVLLAPLVAGCSVPADQAPPTLNPDWMIGEWAWVSLPEEPKVDGKCSEENEFYRRDGYVLNGQSISRWWIQGNTLVRVQVGEAYGEPATGKPHRIHFHRDIAGNLVFEGDGYTQKLIRCGDVPAEWDRLPVP